MRFMRSVLLLSALAASLLILSCGNNSPAPAKAAEATPATAPAPVVAEVKDTGVVITVVLDAKSWKFTPEEIHGKLGDTLNITLKNTVGLHSAKMDDGYKMNLKDGVPKTVKLTVAGKFQYYCGVQCGHGHDEMVGYLIVD
ncbi:MAG: hypothetical protein WCG80_10255 [Spirochaetales bacterium]